jgi:hypothetical protein
MRSIPQHHNDQAPPHQIETEEIRGFVRLVKIYLMDFLARLFASLTWQSITLVKASRELRQ